MRKVNVVLTTKLKQKMKRFKRVFQEKTGIKEEGLNFIQVDYLNKEDFKKIVILADNQTKEKDDIFLNKHRDKHTENVKDLDFEELAEYIFENKKELKVIIFNDKNVAYATNDTDCDYFISQEMLEERERNFMEQFNKLER